MLHVAVQAVHIGSRARLSAAYSRHTGSVIGGHPIVIFRGFRPQRDRHHHVLHPGRTDSTILGSTFALCGLITRAFNTRAQPRH